METRSLADLGRSLSTVIALHKANRLPLVVWYESVDILLILGEYLGFSLRTGIAFSAVR